jgi:hypothetical protein
MSDGDDFEDDFEDVGALCWLVVGFVSVLMAGAAAFGIRGEGVRDKFTAAAFNVAGTSEQGRQQIKSVLDNGGKCSVLAPDFEKVCNMLKDANDLYRDPSDDSYFGGDGNCNKMRFDMRPACEAAKEISLNP